MEKLFKSKLAFIAFVILFTSFLAFFYKNAVSVALYSGLIAGFIGFVVAQWYWVEKMKEIQHLLDARMASPETAELLKSKDKQINEMANEKIQIIERIVDLQKEIELLKNPLNKVRAKFRCDSIVDSPNNEAGHVYFYPVTDGSEENKSFSKMTPCGQLMLAISYETPAHNFFKENEEY